MGKGGGLIVFGADPVSFVIDFMLFCVGYLINKWVDRNQICMGIILGHDEDLIRFW